MSTATKKQVTNLSESQPDAPKSEPTPTQQKMWAWVQRAWETSPTDIPLHKWYQKFREELYAMYTAQNEQSTNNP